MPTEKKLVYTKEITESIIVGFKKKQIVRSRNIFTDIMINGVTNKRILSVIPSIIFNL